MKSSIIKALTYDPTTKELTVHFHTGAVYLYQDVSAQRMRALREAKSVGAYFCRYIKDVYEFRRIDHD
jgi:hypothetical protein